MNEKPKFYVVINQHDQPAIMVFIEDNEVIKPGWYSLSFVGGLEYSVHSPKKILIDFTGMMEEKDREKGTC